MRFTFNRSVSTAPDPVVQRWQAIQSTFVESDEEISGPGIVFWRLAVRHRAVAIDATPASDLEESLRRARRAVRRAASLQVCFGFTEGQSVPNWVVHDDGTPVMIGLPARHLVLTSDPTRSLAAYLSAAQVKASVNDIGTVEVPGPRLPPGFRERTDG